MGDDMGDPATDIRELDGADPATTDLLLPAAAAMSAAELVGAPPPTREYLSVQLTVRAGLESTVFAAFDADGAPVLFARVNRDPEVNPAIADTVLWADPGRRDAATESAFLATLTGWVRERGGDRLIVEAPLTPALTGFGDRNGGRLVSTDRRSVLELAGVSRERFAELAAPSEKNAEYRIERWSGSTAEALLPAFAEANNAINDAPHPDLGLDDRIVTPERLRAREANTAARGLTQHVVAAVAPDGAIGAFTQIYTYPGDYGQAGVGSTVAPAAHRGRGLGLRLKADQTLWVLDRLPWISAIETWNNEDNAPMLKVNQALGYRLAEEWGRLLFEF